LCCIIFESEIQSPSKKVLLSAAVHSTVEILVRWKASGASIVGMAVGGRGSVVSRDFCSPEGNLEVLLTGVTGGCQVV